MLAQVDVHIDQESAPRRERPKVPVRAETRDLKRDRYQGEALDLWPLPALAIAGMPTAAWCPLITGWLLYLVGFV